MKLLVVLVLAAAQSAAFAQQFTNFRFNEKGHVGELIVLNEQARGIPLKPIAVSVLSGNSKTHHQCELRALENTSARVQSNDSLSATMVVVDSNNVATSESFEIVFKGRTAVISGGKASSHCGLSATFNGAWQRTK